MLALAWANGANDDFKGVATLYGRGTLSYRRALWLASAATAGGALASACLAERLARTFSGHGVVAPALGYGREESLVLDLVFNPTGPTLPPPQAELEADFRRHLRAAWGVEFTHLLTITNMPIGRFQEDLCARGRGEEYARLLRERSIPENVAAVMCRRQVHVSNDGTLHDCDFNYALGLDLAPGLPRKVADAAPGELARRRILTGEHCHGCTAGNGSSCGGALR